MPFCRNISQFPPPPVERYFTKVRTSPSRDAGLLEQGLQSLFRCRITSAITLVEIESGTQCGDFCTCGTDCHRAERICNVHDEDAQKSNERKHRKNEQTEKPDSCHAAGKQHAKKRKERTDERKEKTCDCKNAAADSSDSARNNAAA